MITDLLRRTGVQFRRQLLELILKLPDNFNPVIGIYNLYFLTECDLKRQEVAGSTTKGAEKKKIQNGGCIFRQDVI